MTITGLTAQDTSSKWSGLPRYRSEDSSNGDLAIYKDGSFKIIYEDEISGDQLVKAGSSISPLAFGPSLVENGEITVDTSSEGQGNLWHQIHGQRIGIIDENHYIIVVSDGRTSESQACLSTN